MLTIDVIEAKSEYEYSQGLVFERHITGARCVLEAEFRCGDADWRQRFSASAREAEDGMEGGTKLLDRVWDDVALRVTASVVEHLPRREVTAEAFAPRTRCRSS